MLLFVDFVLDIRIELVKGISVKLGVCFVVEIILVMLVFVIVIVVDVFDRRVLFNVVLLCVLVLVKLDVVIEG